MIRDDIDPGVSPQIWDRAKEEARKAMIEVARRRDTMYYTDLTEQIKSCKLRPQEERLFHMLGQISTDEDEAGRGLLTAVVVRKSNKMPGNGFFRLARSRGRDTSDKDRCWRDELGKVHEAWS